MPFRILIKKLRILPGIRSFLINISHIEKQIIRTRLPLGKLGSDYIALVPVTGLDYIMVSPGPLPGEKLSTGQFYLDGFESLLTITHKKDQSPDWSFLWCNEAIQIRTT